MMGMPSKDQLLEALRSVLRPLARPITPKQQAITFAVLVQDLCPDATVDPPCLEDDDWCVFIEKANGELSCHVFG